MILWMLFLAFFKIGSLSIGGGYAILPLIQQDMVEQYHWLTQQDFMNLITLSQMTPGPIAINSSTFVGMRVAGVLGAIVATLGCIITGVFISISLYRFFQKHKDNKNISYVLLGMRAVSLGLIGASSISIFMSALTHVNNSPLVMEGINVAAIIIFVGAMYVTYKYKWSPILVLLCSGFIGLIIYQ